MKSRTPKSVLKASVIGWFGAFAVPGRAAIFFTDSNQYLVTDDPDYEIIFFGLVILLMVLIVIGCIVRSMLRLARKKIPPRPILHHQKAREFSSIRFKIESSFWKPRARNLCTHNKSAAAEDWRLYVNDK